jgi:hypothetical protein
VFSAAWPQFSDILPSRHQGALAKIPFALQNVPRSLAILRMLVALLHGATPQTIEITMKATFSIHSALLAR